QSFVSTPFFTASPGCRAAPLSLEAALPDNTIAANNATIRPITLVILNDSKGLARTPCTELCFRPPPRPWLHNSEKAPSKDLPRTSQVLNGLSAPTLAQSLEIATRRTSASNCAGLNGFVKKLTAPQEFASS